MNLIITPTRALLLTKTVSALLFIRLVGPPVSRFPLKKAKISRVRVMVSFSFS